MPRSHSAPKRRRVVSDIPRPKPEPKPVVPRPGSLTLDSKTEKEVNGLFMTLFRRLIITCVIMLLIGLVCTLFAKQARLTAAPVIFFSILLGVSIAYHRGVDKVFSGIKQIGKDRLQEKRYADAVFALDNFHRMGNMGIDRDGEAHYMLMKAYEGLHDTVKTDEIAAWLRKHRSRSQWTAKIDKKDR